MSTRRTHRTLISSLVACVASLALAACTATSDEETIPTPTASTSSDVRDAVTDVIDDAMAEWGLRAVIVRVDRGGEPVMTEAFGESLAGVPATPDMHFRNGAVAISYVATVLLRLVDDGVVALDDTIDEWLPDVPHADEVTLGQLAQMTSGYADYMWDADFLRALEVDPFRQWSPAELVAIGTSKPLVYEPGSNWNYSHTDYVLLGLALEAATGTPMTELMQEHVLSPLGLDDTADPGTPAVQEPVLHAYSAERRGYLGIADDVAFLEQTTFWNPSWTITRGAIQNTNIDDLARGARAVGTGELLSAESHEAQVNHDTREFASLIEGCPACFPHSDIYTYGIGVVMMGDWILQNPMFSGTAAVGAYLPSDGLTIAVVTTFEEDAFDASGGVPNRATDLFRALVDVLAPDAVPPTRPAE